MSEPEQINQWVRLCREGNQDGFRLIYNSEKGRLYGLALRLCRTSEDAQDCLQEAFIRIYNSIHSFRENSSFRTWMYRIVVNTCLNHLERQPVRDTLDPDLIPAADADPDGTLAELETAIGKLTDGNRTVFVLYEIEGFNHKEIADLLDITEGTSKSRLSRAKEELRNLLNGRL